MTSPTTFESRRRSVRDAGLTLVELMVVLVILPIIMGAMAFGLVAVFHLQSSVSQRLSGSVDLQQVSAQFVKDVQNSEQILLGVTPQKCGTTGVQLLGLAWNKGATTGGANNFSTMVSYVSIPMTNNSTNYSLERLYCTLGNMNSPVKTTVLSSDFYVSNALLQQSPPAVCTGTLNPTGSNCQSAPPPSQCAIIPIPANCQLVFNADQVAGVTFTLYVPMSSAPYEMVAIPRGGTAPNTGNAFTSMAGITLLGSCTSGNVLTVGKGNVTVSTFGGQPGSGYIGLLNCPASSITLANNGVINAAGILTGATGSGGIVGGNGSSYPPNVTYTSGLCNPLQDAPPGAGCTATASQYIVPPTQPPYAGSCTTPGKGSNNQYVWTCTAGYYTAATTPNFQNGSIIYFTGTYLNSGVTTPGVTWFSSDVQIPNGATVYFNSSNQTTDPAFVFAANDGGAFSTQTSNQQNAGISISGNGVLLYVPTGGMTFSNNTQVSLSGASQWQGVDIWLNAASYNLKTGVGVLTLGNNSTSTFQNNYGGIYVPYGTVVDSNNGSITVSFIVTGSATFSSNINITVTGYTSSP